MLRNEFVEKIDKTNAYELRHNGKTYIVYYDMAVDFPDGSGKLYDSFEELFEAKAEDVTIGDLVDRLKAFNDEFIYHVPTRIYDENGNKEDI